MAMQQDDFIKKPHLIEKFSNHQAIELLKCAKDPIYFCENYVKVQHPTKGAIPFKLYHYQRTLIQNYVSNRWNVTMQARQSGKTATTAAYLLWYAIFNDDKTILIAANVMAQAMEIMDRIRFAYEELPNWVKAGVTTYNKGSLYFDNGSRIISRATTASMGRGLSISLLYVDEMAYLPPRIASEAWTSIQPTLSTGGSCIISSTPNSDEDQFAQIWYGAINNIDEYGNERPNGVGKNGFKALLVTWKEHPDRDEKWAEEQQSIIGDERFRREFNCEFIQDEETLIDSMVLARLSGIEPTTSDKNKVRWYAVPQPNRTYICALDPSTGTGGDFAAIQLYQLPEMIQVAEWKHNKTPVKGQVSILQDILIKVESDILKSGNQEGDLELYWTVENNGVGEAALEVIKDTDEENFPGTFISEPKKSRVSGKRRKGLHTSTTSKLNALVKLKSLIETNRIAVTSKALISELKQFVSSGRGSKTFKAKYGAHDDLISALSLCIRIMQILSHRDPDFDDDLREIITDDEDGERRDPMPIMIL